MGPNLNILLMNNRHISFSMLRIRSVIVVSHFLIVIVIAYVLIFARAQATRDIHGKQISHLK